MNLPSTLVLSLTAFACLVSQAYGADVSVAGDWTRSIDANDLSGGPGTDIAGQILSATSATTVSVSNSSGSWRLSLRRSDNNWNPQVTLFVRRTSSGTGSGIIAGGEEFIEVRGIETEIFAGSGGRSNVALQFKLVGVSTKVPAGSCSTTLIYTVSP